MEEEQTPLILNKYKKAMVAEIIEAEAAQNAILRERALTDLYIFNKYVLKAEEGSDIFVKLAPFHKEMCRFVTDSPDYAKLLLFPRGHLKSKMVTIGRCVQRIMKDPSVRILIYNATWQMSVDFLGEIKRQLTSNELLTELWGDVAADPVEWSQDRIKLRGSNKKEPTVMATGIDTNVVASHFDMIIFDDVINRDNSSTKEQLDKVVLRYKDSTPLLEPGGEKIVIGTRWDDRDLYNYILDKENGMIDGFKVMSKAALEGYYWDQSQRAFVDSGIGKILWPEKYSLADLTKARRDMGAYAFSCQMMNDPVPDDSATFRRQYFQYYDRATIRNRTFNIVTTVDPALSLDKEADFTAMVTVGIDEFANIYILDMVRNKFTPDQLISELFNVYVNWMPGTIGVEDVALTKTLGYMLKREQERRHRFLPIKPISPQMRTKNDRIKGLEPIYENQKIFHPEGHPLTPQLEEELTRFPRSTHDDLVDALSYVLDFLYPPRTKSDRKHQRSAYLYSGK